MSESSGHSAYSVWRVKVNRAILQVVPSLGKKSSAQLFFSIMMIVLTIFGMFGFGIYLDGYGIHPPQQYTGVCPAPAIIRGGNCINIVSVTITQSGTTTTTTSSEQAGRLILPNGTSIKR